MNTDSVQFTVVRGFGSAINDVREIGLQTTVTGGTLFARRVTSADIDIANNKQYRFTWKLSVGEKEWS